MHPMSNMLTVNYRKLQKNGNEEKIEMSNMLKEKKERKNNNNNKIVKNPFAATKR
jgi:hypothetical protein